MTKVPTFTRESQARDKWNQSLKKSPSSWAFCQKSSDPATSSLSSRWWWVDNENILRFGFSFCIQLSHNMEDKEVDGSIFFMRRPSQVKKMKIVIWKLSCCKGKTGKPRKLIFHTFMLYDVKLYQSTNSYAWTHL